ncbi:MAG: cytochrome bd-I ubiquinol oxidase subunit CydA [Rhodospirillaceae bacterium]|jgi:cytochrome bd ubiquinol oxidase subunit I|nr:cytochrome bd-I ubiquinol oxidase subunit CydA [Rhodospirillaceae bacterium]MBT5752809.1 cytochrome bd-I ubiquinol oxidase subunit CydA [Rhodospirillaceae bacterium]
MTDFEVVDLSRLQFAITALYHFLFVPLTLGLSLLLAIMESVYVMTGREIWRKMTKFWGLLFGINFAMGVATGLTMEFQFGTNWAYFSHYVGDIFGVPLAIEGMMAFFLESTFVGLFFFGWNRLSKIGHLIVTWLVAIGSQFSALWILIANGWMQNPVGAKFNFETMRMEVDSFADVILNPVAQAKFVHTVSAGYVVGSMFVLSISAFYLLRGRHIAFAKRSMTVAASFGLAAALSAVVLGDESGYYAEDYQKMKIASLEAMWETEPAPAPLTLFGIPDPETKEVLYRIDIPFLLGLIATRSYDTVMPGINELVYKAKGRIRNGLIGYEALQTLRNDKENAAARETLEAHIDDLGHALLLKKYREDIENATDEEIVKASEDTAPNVLPLFFSFRTMVACGFYFIALFGFSFYLASRRMLTRYRWYLHVALWSLPLPWIAAETGWIVAEYGRQPWIISEILPTFLGASSVPVGHVLFSLIGFIVFYTALLVIDMFLMVKYIRLGPPEDGEKA